KIVFTVEGQLAWGHCLHVLDAQRIHIGTVQQVLLSFLPKFELYCGGEYMGCIRKELTFLFPKYDIDCNGWAIDGDFMQWDYTICDGGGNAVASISKELMHLTDTYVIDVANPGDALCALMVVLAIDAEKCSQN
ncbi:MAG: hypothetical protein RRY95_02550, partial [Oscillospiraceae bacterium]